MSVFFFFFKQKTAYEMRISDWSSDVCSSDLPFRRQRFRSAGGEALETVERNRPAHVVAAHVDNARRSSNIAEIINQQGLAVAVGDGVRLSNLDCQISSVGRHSKAARVCLRRIHLSEIAEANDIIRLHTSCYRLRCDRRNYRRT